jgi:hypothetical protein
VLRVHEAQRLFELDGTSGHHLQFQSLMKFSARSYSPSPVRGKHRSSSTFGIQSDSESEEYDTELDSFSTSDDDDDSVSTVSDSSSSSLKSLLVTSALNNLAMYVSKNLCQSSLIHFSPQSSKSRWPFAVRSKTH